MTPKMIEPILKLLLISNSWNLGEQYLQHATAWLSDIYHGVPTVLVLPFAVGGSSHFVAESTTALREMGIQCEVAALNDPLLRDKIAKATGFYVPGGNTFRLSMSLHKAGILNAIAKAVHGGVPFAGASAGAVIAGPTIATTNDMPIVESPLGALDIVPFQINTHYLETAAVAGQPIESRDDRLKEYVRETHRPVLALSTGTALSISEGVVNLLGDKNCKVFFWDATIHVTPGPIDHEVLVRLMSVGRR